MNSAAVEQKKEQPQAPAFTVQMGEAGFSINVKILDPFGQEVMLTFRAPLASHADTMIDYYSKRIKSLIDAGWQPLKAGAKASQESAKATTDDVPTCRVHGSRMKPSKKAGSFYCPRKEGDNWCKEKVG